MKYFVQFYDNRPEVAPDSVKARGPVKKWFVEPCGSDSVFILDGRNNVSNMINDGYERLGKLKNVHPSWCAFRIMRGTRFSNGQAITGFYEVTE